MVSMLKIFSLAASPANLTYLHCHTENTVTNIVVSGLRPFEQAHKKPQRGKHQEFEVFIPGMQAGFVHLLPVGKSR